MNNHNTIAGEEAEFLINEHWAKYAPAILFICASWIIYAFCLNLSLAVNAISHLLSMFSIIFGHALLLILHHIAFYRFFSASTRLTLITNRRILSSQQHPWISDKVSDVPLWRVRSIEVQKKGLLQHIFNYGSLILNREELPTIERVPHPHSAHSQLMPHIQSMQPAMEKNQINQSI